MAVTGTVIASGRVFGGPSGPLDLALAWTLTSGNVWQTSADLAAGDNPMFVPPGTTLVAIIPPAGNAETIAVKGSTGSTDTGCPLGVNTPSLLSFNGAAGVLVLRCGGAVTITYLCL